MDLQAAETAHQRDPRDQISYTKKTWNCPCNGCKKAVKQERQRILEEIEQMYKDADVVHDDQVSKTTELIQKALIARNRIKSNPEAMSMLGRSGVGAIGTGDMVPSEPVMAKEGGIMHFANKGSVVVNPWSSSWFNNKWPPSLGMLPYWISGDIQMDEFLD